MNHVPTEASALRPRHEEQTPSIPTHYTTPPYVIDEGTRINALECTVQRIASDLSSSKDQIREVKELLLRLINPQTVTPPLTSAPISNADLAFSGDKSTIAEPLRYSPGSIAPTHTGVDSASHYTRREPCMRMSDVIQTRAPTLQVLVACGRTGADTSPSWGSGDPIPVTPNTLLQNFTNSLPVGAVVSIEVSASIWTTAVEHSPHPSMETINQYREPERRPLQPQSNTNLESLGRSPAGPSSNNGVSIQGMTTVEQAPTTVRPPRQRFEYGLLPRCTSSTVAANAMCFILHPDKGDTVVAEGRTDGS